MTETEIKRHVTAIVADWTSFPAGLSEFLDTSPPVQALVAALNPIDPSLFVDEMPPTPEEVPPVREAADNNHSPEVTLGSLHDVLNAILAAVREGNAKLSNIYEAVRDHSQVRGMSQEDLDDHFSASLIAAAAAKEVR